MVGILSVDNLILLCYEVSYLLLLQGDFLNYVMFC